MDGTSRPVPVVKERDELEGRLKKQAEANATRGDVRPGLLAQGILREKKK